MYFPSDGCVRERAFRAVCLNVYLELFIVPTLFKCECPEGGALVQEKIGKGAEAFAQNGGRSIEEPVSGLLIAYIFPCQKVTMDSGFFHYRSLHTRQEGRENLLEGRSQQTKEMQGPSEPSPRLAGQF